MLEPVDKDTNDDDDVMGQKRRPQKPPPATVISPITFGSAKCRLGVVKARDTTVVATATSEATDVRRTLRIGRVIVAKRAATTTATSDDDNDDSNDIHTTKSAAKNTTTASDVAKPEVKKRLICWRWRRHR